MEAPDYMTAAEFASKWQQSNDVTEPHKTRALTRDLQRILRFSQLLPEQNCFLSEASAQLCHYDTFQ